ncbi:MAG: hypothetical protein ACM3WS_01095 [Bacillota bacterium]
MSRFTLSFCQMHRRHGDAPHVFLLNFTNRLLQNVASGPGLSGGAEPEARTLAGRAKACKPWPFRRRQDRPAQSFFNSLLKNAPAVPSTKL